jgi:hypothetical protein
VEAISNSRGRIGTLKPKGKGKREDEYLERKDEHGAGSSKHMSRKTGRDFQTYCKVFGNPIFVGSQSIFNASPLSKLLQPTSPRLRSAPFRAKRKSTVKRIVCTDPVTRSRSSNATRSVNRCSLHNEQHLESPWNRHQSERSYKSGTLPGLTSSLPTPANETSGCATPKTRSSSLPRVTRTLHRYHYNC